MSQRSERPADGQTTPYRKLFCQMEPAERSRYLEPLQGQWVNYRTHVEAEQDYKALGRPTRSHKAYLWGLKIERLGDKLTPMLVMGKDADSMNDEGVGSMDLGQMLSSAMASMFERRDVDIASIYDLWPHPDSKKYVAPVHPLADEAHFHALKVQKAGSVGESTTERELRHREEIAQQEALERELPMGTLRSTRVVMDCPHCGKQLGVTVYLSPLDDDGTYEPK